MSLLLLLVVVVGGAGMVVHGEYGGMWYGWCGIEWRGAASLIVFHVVATLIVAVGELFPPRVHALLYRALFVNLI